MKEEISFQIYSVKTKSQSIEPPDDFVLKDRLKDIGFSLSSEIGTETKTDNLSFDLTFRVLLKMKSEELEIARVQTLNIFNVKSLSKYVKKEKGELTYIDDNLLDRLLDISLSHTRGIFAHISKGSSLEQLVVPIFKSPARKKED